MKFCHPVDPISDPSAMGEERSDIFADKSRDRRRADIAASLSLGFTEIASSSSAKAAANVKRFRVAEFEILWPILRRLPRSETALDFQKTPRKASSFPVSNGYCLLRSAELEL